MAIKAQITVDNSELKKGLKEAENTAKGSMSNVQKSVAGANTMFSKLAASAGNASKAISSGMQGVTSILTKLGPVGAVVAAGITTIGAAAIGTVTLVNKLATKLNDIAKSAKSVNMTANQYLALQYASTRAGVAMDDVLSIISKTDQAMVKAAEGEKKYRDAFYAIGLTWKDLSKLSPEKQIIAIAEAFSKIKSEGRGLPSEIFDVFNRKDIRNLNKLSKEDVGRLAAEAGALGIKIDEEAIRTAEELQDIYGDINQKIIAWASNLKAAKAAMKEIKNIAKNASDFLGKDGEVLPEYSNIAESYITVAKRLTQSGKFSDAQMRDMVKASKLDLNPLTSAGLMQSGGYLAFVEQVNKEVAKMSKEDLQQEMNNIKFDSMGNNLAKTVHKAVADIDKRFANGLIIAKNKDYTYQRSSEEIAADKVRDLAEDTNRELIKQVRYYDSITNKIGIEFDVERKILDLEKELSDVTNKKVNNLDESLKISLRQNAALMKQKAIEVELKKVSDSRKASLSKSLIDIFGSLGGDATALSFVNDSLRSIGRDMNTEFVKSIQRALEYEQGKSANKALSINEMLNMDPRAFFESARTAGHDLSDGYGPGRLFDDKDLLDQIKFAQDSYNKIASERNLEPLSIDLQVGSYHFDEQLKSIDEAISGMKEYEKNLDLIKQKEEELAKLKGDSLRRAKIGEEIAKLKESLNVLQSLKDARNIVSEFKLISNVQNSLREASTQLRAKKSVSFMSSAEDTEFEAEMVKAQLEGNQKIADTIQRKNMLKKAGLSMTEYELELYERELNAITNAEKKLASAKLAAGMYEQGIGNVASLIQKGGNELGANRINALYSAEKQKGSPLSDREKELISRLSDLTTYTKNLQMPQLKDNIIHTNELAAKGGFSSSVAVERRDSTTAIENFQKEVYKLWQQQITLDTQIRNSLKN